LSEPGKYEVLSSFFLEVKFGTFLPTVEDLVLFAVELGKLALLSLEDIEKHLENVHLIRPSERCKGYSELTDFLQKGN
jgi:hypothetical protein